MFLSQVGTRKNTSNEPWDKRFINSFFFPGKFGSFSSAIFLHFFPSVFFISLFYLSNRPHFLGVYRLNKPLRDVRRTREKLVNHSPDGS